MDFLRCVVERIPYQNDDNGYSVIKVRAKGFAELVTVVGGMAGVNVGWFLENATASGKTTRSMAGNSAW